MLLLRPTQNLGAKMTPKNMSATITAARENFVSVTGKPKYGYLLRLSECLTLILIGIPYNIVDVDHNLCGILSSDAAYKARYNKVFTPLTHPTIYPTIPVNTTSFVRSLSDTVHKLLWHYFKLHKAAKLCCRAFIIKSVEDTWISELRNTKTIYSNVTTKEPMDHLQLSYGGLHTLDIVDITSQMLTFYGGAAGITKYINMLEYNQKKSQQIKLPMPNVTLIDIATKSIL